MHARVLAMPAHQRYAVLLLASALLVLAAIALGGSPQVGAQHLADGPGNGYWWGG
ncbi:MAG TPA: hypothetical protein PKH97_12520 [Tetrasphaera sp.]|jgi:hypothetical protein|uniref:Uncharacterized protein n=1 Tax=Nostocoides vanveenii TaxID=330835 RepID=A0ABN2K8J8_9MICO|nr:hypothetical protein [Tetrasphaera sp.]HNQ07994.1 hypothetical protein [Tetrasphaera sp.]